MDAEKLKEILRLHKKYLLGESGGVRADLRETDLRWAKLSWANLTGADLRWANLSEANLMKADLRWAKLSWADLRWANLTGANLTGADLTGADLTGANLTGADLTGADLTGAGLSMAIGKLSVYFGGRHPGWAAGGRIGIGCEVHDYQHWLDHGIEIGQANRYSEAEIKRYMAWVVSTVEWLREESAE